MRVLDDDSLDQIEVEHKTDRHETPRCATCAEPWPCTATLLVREIRRLRGALREIGSLVSDYA